MERRLALFLVGCVLLGSLVTWVLTRIPTNPTTLALVALPISYIPAALAVLMVRLGGDPEEASAFRRRLSIWRLPVRWYAVALLGLPLVHVTGVALATLWGGLLPVHLASLALLPLFLLTNLGEEIGWRGYALPQLLGHFDSLTASLILGGVWAAFHWVALAQNPSRPWGYVAISSVHLVAMSVIMTWVLNHTRESVLLMALLHAAVRRRLHRCRAADRHHSAAARLLPERRGALPRRDHAAPAVAAICARLAAPGRLRRAAHLRPSGGASARRTART